MLNRQLISKSLYENYVQKFANGVYQITVTGVPNRWGTYTVTVAPSLCNSCYWFLPTVILEIFAFVNN